MSARVFKVGDRVRCVNAHMKLPVGSVHTVTSLSCEFGCNYVGVDDEPRSGWSETRFELVKDEITLPTKDQILAAGEKSPEAKAVLKELFPGVFPKVRKTVKVTPGNGGKYFQCGNTKEVYRILTYYVGGKQYAGYTMPNWSDVMTVTGEMTHNECTKDGEAIYEEN